MFSDVAELRSVDRFRILYILKQRFSLSLSIYLCIDFCPAAHGDVRGLTHVLKN